MSCPYKLPKSLNTKKLEEDFKSNNLGNPSEQKKKRRKEHKAVRITGQTNAP